jgi:ABC-type sugar transport system ATPase subunit
VLDSVNFEVKRGEVHALVGANGAGKIYANENTHGIYSTTEGEMYLNGTKVCFANPQDAYKAGVSMIHRELDLVTNLSVSENIFLGREKSRGCLLTEKK